MVSAAEQLAKNINFSAFAKAEELKKRLWFVVLALLVFRLGTHIPLPGIDPRVMEEIFKQNQNGLLGMFDMFSGGALKRMSIFALNIMPYISASIIVQLMSSVVPSMEEMKKDGEAGRKRMNQYTRYLTVLLASVQAYGLAVGLESMSGPTGSAVINPGFFFRFVVVATLLGGTMFLMWLGEQMTSRGIGNGISLIIFAGIVAGLPSALVRTFELAKTQSIPTLLVLLIPAGVVAVVAFIVFMERAHRRIIIQYPKRQMGAGIVGGEASHMPLKLNTSGVIPPIFASSLLMLPTTVLGFIGKDAPGWLTMVKDSFQRGQWVYMVLYSSLIIFFSFFYTAVVFNPTETADNLRKYGGFIPGIRPGKSTADYLDFVLTRITVIGAAYLVFVCLLPEFLISKMNLPFYFGGTSLLIVVSVTMDTVAQVHSHLLAHQYEGLLKKAKLRGRRS
ncbi:MAG: preprotein translocase subunit SecY [Alphaproteobacteria bacterium GWF2_58_20]|nr:MAG: preprotein translocase subunit SecY [Alphaproteobacteria bacterium GWF2_58_20]